MATTPTRRPAAKRPAARRPRDAASSPEPPVVLPAVPTELSLKALARQLQSLTSSVLSMAGTATDLGVTLARSRLTKPEHKAAVEKADSLLKDLRQTAGLTAQDLSRALGLSAASELDRFESGRVAMPFELILRAASVLGRKDPVTFIMRATRAYNPDLWRALEALGVGKLVVQGAREREFANLYRARDAARALDDTQFAAVLAFAGAAFDLALDLVAKTHKPGRPAKSATSKVAPP